MYYSPLAFVVYYLFWFVVSSVVIALAWVGFAHLFALLEGIKQGLARIEALLSDKEESKDE